MENLSPIIERIIEKAKDESAGLLQKAGELAAKIVADGFANAKLKEEKILADAALAGEEELRRVRVTSRLDARNEVLTAKGKLISDVFYELPLKLHSLTSKDYASLIRGFVLSVAPLGLVHVIPAEVDKEVFNSAFVMGINQVLQNRGQETTLILTGETMQSGGGLFLKSDTIEVNCSLESICDFYKEALEPVISSALFSD